MPQKKNPDATSTTKMLALYTLLFFQPREFSLGELAEKLECSKQTVLRLCTQLECFAAEFRTEIRGKQRFYWLESPPQRPSIGMAPLSLNCLAMCKNLSAHLLPKGVVQEADLAIARAATLLTDLSKRAEAIDIPVGVRGKGFIDYSPRQTDLVNLLEAAKKRSVCQVKYKKSDDDEERTHYFLPGKIVSHHESLYVLGWSVTEQGIVDVRFPMTLALHRIQNVTQTIRSAKDDVDLNLEDEAIRFGVIDGEEFIAIIVFSERTAQYVRERIWSKEQKIEELPEGTIRLEFSASSIDEVAAWILSFGREAIVIQPADLRQRVTEEVQALSLMYSKI